MPLKDQLLEGMIILGEDSRRKLVVRGAFTEDEDDLLLPPNTSSIYFVYSDR